MSFWECSMKAHKELCFVCFVSASFSLYRWTLSYWFVYIFSIEKKNMQTIKGKAGNSKSIMVKSGHLSYAKHFPSEAAAMFDFLCPGWYSQQTTPRNFMWKRYHFCMHHMANCIPYQLQYRIHEWIHMHTSTFILAKIEVQQQAFGLLGRIPGSHMGVPTFNS